MQFPSDHEKPGQALTEEFITQGKRRTGTYFRGHYPVSQGELFVNASTEECEL